MSDIPLGLGVSPDPVFLYVGESIDEVGEVHPWHTFDHDSKKQIPVKARALTGILTDITMKMTEFKGKTNVKLRLSVKADKPYVIQTGAETTFARGVLLSLDTIKDYSKPLTFVVANGGEKVVFGRVHDGESGERIRVQWDKDRKLFSLIQNLQRKLGRPMQTWAEVQATLSKEPQQRQEEAPQQDNDWTPDDDDGPPF